MQAGEDAGHNDHRAEHRSQNNDDWRRCNIVVDQVRCETVVKQCVGCRVGDHKPHQTRVVVFEHATNIEIEPSLASLKCCVSM